MSTTERRDVVVGIDEPAAGGLYLTATPSGIVLDGKRLFVTDRSRDEVLEIRTYRNHPEVRLFAGAGRGIADPRAVAIAPHGTSLFIASGSEKRLTLFDVLSRAMIAQLELDFESSRPDSLAGGSIYLLNVRGAGRETLQVFEVGRHPAVYFVPAASSVSRRWQVER